MKKTIITVHSIQIIATIVLAFVICQGIGTLDFVWALALSLGCGWMIACTGILYGNQKTSTIIIIFECILLGVILFFALYKVMQDETGLILNGDMNRIILFFVALMMSVIVAPILNGAIWNKFHYDKIEQIN